MEGDKRVVGKALVNVLKQIRDSRKEQLLNYIYEDDKIGNKEDIKYDVDEFTLLREGDIITISPAFSAVLTPMGVGSMEKGDFRFSGEVWEVKAVNSLHIKVERLTNYSGNFEEKIFLIQKEDYDYSFADDFVN